MIPKTAALVPASQYPTIFFPPLPSAKSLDVNAEELFLAAVMVVEEKAEIEVANLFNVFGLLEDNKFLETIL